MVRFSVNYKGHRYTVWESAMHKKRFFYSRHNGGRTTMMIGHPMDLASIRKGIIRDIKAGGKN
jgi:hypothetical protein